MNKQYTLAAALVLTAGAVMAQSGGKPVRKERAQAAERQTHAQAPELRGSSIWSDDFSDPSNWTISHVGSVPLDWQVGIGLTNQGEFPTPAILSTTADNGYAMIDSDGGNNQTANYEKASLTTADPIDLSAFPNVIIQFQNQYRKYTDEQCYLVISTNNTDWPDIDPDTDISGMPNVFYVWQPTGELTQGVSPGNPKTKRFNISAVAGGQPQVWVRFLWTGIWGYSWFVDDVAIVEQAQYDMEMLNGYLSHTGTGEEYGRIPSSEIPAGSTMSVGGGYLNFGVDGQTNVQVNAEIRDAGNVLQFNASSTPATVAPAEELMMDVPVTLPALANGVYTGTFSVTSDQNANDGFPENNQFLRTFEVTSDVYSLDGIDNHPVGYQSLTSTGTNTFEGAADGLFLFTYYPVTQDFTVYGLEILLANGTVLGGQVEASIHDTTTVVDDDPNSPLVISDQFTITQYEIDNGKLEIRFPTPYTLTPGAYYAAVMLNSNDSANTIRVLDDLTVPQPSGASLIYDPSDGITYGNGNAYAIRLSANPALGIRDMDELTGIGVYPNPSTGLVNITAIEGSNHNVEVFDVLGNVVRTDRFNLNTTMDLSGMAKGVYSVRVSNEKGATVQRVTLN